MPTLLEKLRAVVSEGPPDECWEFTGSPNAHGYGTVKLDGTNIGVHRVAFFLAYGSIPEGLCVLHSCDNRKCANPEHLSIGDRGDNNRDRDQKDRNNRGERHHDSPLTDFDVRYIRTMYAVGVATQVQLAKEYGMTASCVNRICNRVTWKHLAPNTGEWARG